MKGRPLTRAGVRRRSAPMAIASLAVAVTASSGCLDRPLAPIAPNTTSTITDQLKTSAVDKIDMLIMIDNSASMADKQAILAAAVPDLVNGIVNPACVDAMGNALPTAMQPGPPPATCPTGSNRAFTPVTDIHVGIITSSLGSYGADGCLDTATTACPSGTPLNDQGRLVTRTSANCSADGTPVTTYNDQGFLAWDPNGALSPKGIRDIATFTSNLTGLVTGTGQTGCGFEAQNESWYRFLVDPAPYLSSPVAQGAVPNFCIVDPAKPNSCQAPNLTAIDKNEFRTNNHTDTVLLQQRAEFLRPDSLLAIIVLTDETDVSIKTEGFAPVMAQQSGQLPMARTECQTNGPNDPCCASTGLSTPPAGCPAQPYAMNANDSSAIRAFGLTNGKQSLKARYGVDSLYPTSRYVDALTSSKLKDASGKTFANPLLAQRDPSLVFYATITGVPWQLIARQDTGGKPDLVGGVDPTDKTGMSKGGFKTPAELDAKDASGTTLWDDIVGDPDHYVGPKSPYMQESTVERSQLGPDPILGSALQPPSASDPNADPINGHERNIKGAAVGASDAAGDIQYACRFPRLNADPNDPNDPGNGAKFNNDCTSNSTDPGGMNNPLCEANPNDGGKPTFQRYAKAYPGIRNLAIVRGMHEAQAAARLADTGIVASICAAQLDHTNNQDGTPAADYGYRPAVKAIIDRLKTALGQECLPRPLAPRADGTVPCLILEATPPPPSGKCDCSAIPFRADVKPAELAAVTAAKQTLPETANDCFCEIPPATGTALTDCQTQATTSGDDGWCYIDATVVPPIGDPSLVQGCPSTDRRKVRFVGNGNPAPSATTFFTCEGQ